MARQENASVIINTGSKQGITNPPGNAGYNVSKSMVKAFTEQRECRELALAGRSCLALLAKQCYC